MLKWLLGIAPHAGSLWELRRYRNMLPPHYVEVIATRHTQVHYTIHGDTSGESIRVPVRLFRSLYRAVSRR